MYVMGVGIMYFSVTYVGSLQNLLKKVSTFTLVNYNRIALLLNLEPSITD
jgi:hypothetical protein